MTAAIFFGDDDILDGFDDGDALHVKLDLLERLVLNLIETRGERFHRARTLEGLRLVVKLAPQRTERLDAIRAALLEELVGG